MSEDDEIIGAPRGNTELVGLGDNTDQKDDERIGSDAFNETLDKAQEEWDAEVAAEQAGAARDDDMYDRFSKIEEAKIKNAEEALGIQDPSETEADRLAAEANVDLNENPTKGLDEGAPPARQLTRDQAVNLLKRHAQVKDAMLDGMPEAEILAWAERVQPLWREQQQQYQELSEFKKAAAPKEDGATDDDSIIGQGFEHSEEAASGEPDAQPSLDGVNLEELEKELPEELGEVGKKLVDAVKALAGENKALRGNLQQVAGRQEAREVNEALDTLSKEGYPALETNLQLRKQVHQQAVRQVRTGQYDSISQLMKHSALLVLGAPQASASSSPGVREESLRTRGTPSVPRTRIADAASTQHLSQEDRMYDAFQRVEAEKARKTAQGIPV